MGEEEEEEEEVEEVASFLIKVSSSSAMIAVFCLILLRRLPSSPGLVGFSSMIRLATLLAMRWRAWNGTTAGG